MTTDPETRCTYCHRTLIPRPQWDRLSRAERKRLSRTHAERHAGALCQRDYKRYGVGPSALAYQGEWIPGLVRRPTLVRCPE